MSALKTTVGVAVLVKNAEGKLLLVKKPDGVGPYAGLYTVPSGGLEAGERIDDAVRRELYEETGVTVANLQHFDFVDDVTENWRGDLTHFVSLAYTADYVSGDLRPTEGDDDHLEVIAWFTPEELGQLAIAPHVKQALIKLGYLKESR